MIFHMKSKQVHRPVLKIDKVTLEYVDNFNFLGIIINKHLNWRPHLDNIGKKISKTIGILAKLKHFLSVSTLKIMYDSLIASHLNYGVL